MVSGPVDPSWITATARREGYDLDIFEQAWRMAHLLGEIGAHPWLQGRLALKGGTCINFFHADLPRMSIDLDINYIGSFEKETMLAERPGVMDALRRLGREHGYVPEDVRQSYGGWTVRFVYESVRDARASIKADVNFIMRVPLYGVETLPLPEVFDLGGARAPCLLLEDAYGGKLKAMVVRAEPRDVFDVANLLSSGKVYDEARLRKAFLFYAFLDDASLLTVDLDAIRTIIPLDYSRRLYPVLRRAERPDPDAMVDLVLPHVERMLQLTENERAFSQRLGSGRFEPDLLFRGVQVAKDIHHHPGGEWRRRNPHGRMQRDP